MITIEQGQPSFVSGFGGVFIDGDVSLLRSTCRSSSFVCGADTRGVGGQGGDRKKREVAMRWSMN